MNPQEQFCHNPSCRAYSRAGEGHVVIQRQRERRYRGKRRGRTASATKGTAPARMHKPTAVVVMVVTLLAHGSPLQAIVAAFGFDERTIALWQAAAGAQSRRVREHWSRQVAWSWVRSKPTSCGSWAGGSAPSGIVG